MYHDGYRIAQLYLALKFHIETLYHESDEDKMILSNTLDIISSNLKRLGVDVDFLDKIFKDSCGE